MDYYAVLGVSSAASTEAIKRAYRRLIKQYHPDINPGSQEALDKTIALNQAYDVLSNSSKRAEYDRARDKATAGATEAARRAEEQRHRAREASRKAEEWRRARETSRMGREAARRATEERRAREAGRAGREAARRAEENRRAEEAGRVGGEAARKAETERRRRETAHSGRDGRTVPGAAQQRAGGGKSNLKGRCGLLIALALAAVAGGAVVFLVFPYLSNMYGPEGTPDAAPGPTVAPIPQAPAFSPTPLSPTPRPTATPVPTPTPALFPLPPEMQSPATDREALVQLYEATDGSNWTDNLNWLSDAPLREWYGVDTDPEGRVTLLYLIDNNLNGVVPINLLNMGRLTSLLLGGNPLSGCISEELRAAIYDDDLYTLGLPTCSVVPTPVPPPTPIPTPITIPTARPAPTSTPEPTPSLKFIGGQLLDPLEIEKWVVQYTNAERRNAGLTPFISDPAISNIARMHSENMARSGVFSHTVDGKGPTDRALDNGYDCRAYFPDGSYTYGLSENIYQYPRVRQWIGRSGLSGLGVSYRPETFLEDPRAMAYALVEGWMDSPGHRANILDRDTRRIGVGVAIQQSEKYGYVDEVVFATQNFSVCR